jgi:hypothetical protein
MKKKIISPKNTLVLNELNIKCDFVKIKNPDGTTSTKEL